MKEGTAVLEHLNFFNKIISELLAIDVKLDKEARHWYFWVNSHSHTITSSPSYSTVRKLSSWSSRQLSYLMRSGKDQIKSRNNRVWWSREGKEKDKVKSLGVSKACHFYHKKGHWKNDCKHRRKWLKKEQVVEAEILMSGVDTEVLMTL